MRPLDRQTLSLPLGILRVAATLQLALVGVMAALSAGAAPAARAPEIIAHRTLTPEDDWIEKYGSVRRLETLNGKWAIEAATLPEKEFEGCSNLRVLDSLGTEMWRGMVPGSITMSSSLPSFAVTTPYAHGAGLTVYNVLVSDEPVYRAPDFGGSIIASEDGTAFAARGAGQVVVVAHTGEEIARAKIPYSDFYHLGALADAGKYLAVYGRGWTYPGMEPGTPRLRTPYSVVVFDVTGTVKCRLGPLRHIPRVVTFQDGDPDRITVVADGEISVWDLAASEIWRRDFASDSGDPNQVRAADMSASGRLYVLGWVSGAEERPRLWVWDEHGRVMAEALDLPVDSVGFSSPLQFRALADTAVFVRADTVEAILRLYLQE